MRSGSARWNLLGAAALAIVLLFVLPRFAASVVRTAIESGSATDRAAFAAGQSPWSWTFLEPDDVVAGRVFGHGILAPVPGGLQLRGTDGSTVEIGLPLARPTDLSRLETLRLNASASAPGVYGLSVRETLTEPVRKAGLGTLAPDELTRPIGLGQLAWTDTTGRPISPPARAAMLRLQVTLAAGATLTLHEVSLGFSTGGIEPPAGLLPATLSAEGLLAWRDHQRAADPLVTFGTKSAPRPEPAWLSWLPPIVYLIILGASVLRALTRSGRSPSEATLPASSLRREEPSESRLARTTNDVFQTALVLAGPLWLIAGLGLSARPATPGVVMFAAGVAYAIFLNGRRALPRWEWLGEWRAAGWPLLAIPIAVGIIAFAGHVPVWPPLGRTLVYIGWALFQQWLLLAVAGALLARALPRPWAVLLTALAFALLHTPNGLLMQLCFVAELAWAWWYFHRRALLPIALAHAASAVLLQAGLAGGVLRSLEVSARFLN